MKTFTNSCLIKGYVNSVRIFRGNFFEIINIKMSVFNFKKDGKKYYDTINAQISSRFDKDGKQVLLSDSPYEKLNNQTFLKLKETLKEGMFITISGFLRGVDQIYLDGKWIDFYKLSESEKNQYDQIAKDQLILRNRVSVFITEFQLPFDKKEEQTKEEDNTNEIYKNQADKIESEDDVPIDDDGVVHEFKKSSDEDVPVGETKRFERGKYFNYTDLFPDSIIVEGDYQEEF